MESKTYLRLKPHSMRDRISFISTHYQLTCDVSVTENSIRCASLLKKVVSNVSDVMDVLLLVVRMDP